MRHPRTPIVKVLYALFVGMSASWALVVIDRTSMWDAWKAWGLALLGASMIAAVGLRLVTILDTRWFIRACNANVVSRAVISNDPLESYQVGHREPYFARSR